MFRGAARPSAERCAVVAGTFCSKLRAPGEPHTLWLDAWGSHWRLDATIRRPGKERCGKGDLRLCDPVRTCRGLSPVGCCDDGAEKHAESEGAISFGCGGIVLADVPEEGLARGQVSARSWNSSRTRSCSWSSATIKGRAYAVVPCPRGRNCSSCTTSGGGCH